MNRDFKCITELKTNGVIESDQTVDLYAVVDCDSRILEIGLAVTLRNVVLMYRDACNLGSGGMNNVGKEDEKKEPNLTSL